MLLALAFVLAAADTTPAVVVHRQPAIPLVALRMALLAADPPGYAGAGHLIQHLTEPRLREQAAIVGGRVQTERTADAVVYTVVGPAVELPFLGSILRSAWLAPDPAEGPLLRASRDLAEERLAEWETAASHVRAALRARLFPNAVPAAGTESAALRMAEPGGIRDAWSLLYRPERVSVVAVGDVDVDQVRAAVGLLPRPSQAPPTSELRDTLSLEPLAPAEATRGWIGLGYLAADAEPAAVSVATRLVQEQLQRRLRGALVEGEHWWSHHGQAMALILAVPDSSLAAAQRTAGTGVALARQSLTPERVREAARAIRREMLFFARTPDRMAGVIGQFTDRDGDGDAAQRFYAELDLIDEERVAAVLEAMQERSAARVEIPPQRIVLPR